MPKKARIAPSRWEGVRFPARILAQEEADLLSPRCFCGLSACVVELQAPLTPELDAQPLIEMQNDALVFYCPYHSPISVPEERERQTDAEFFEALRKDVLCFKKSFRRVAINCLRFQPRCLKHCSPILRLLNGISLATAKRIIDTHEAQRKANARTSTDPNRPDGQGVPRG